MKKKITYGFIYAALILLLLVCIFPFYIMIINATHSTNELYTGLRLLPGSNLIENLRNLFAKVNMGRGFLNSFITAGASTLLSIYFGAMTAYGLYEYRFKLRGVIYIILIVSMMIPGQLGIIGLFRLSRNLGILDTYWPIILPSIANAGTIFFVYQFMSGTLEESLLDAARIDGSGEPGIFHRIVIPLVRPGIATMAIFNFVSYWNNFFSPMILLFSEENFTIPLLMNNLNSGMLQDLGAKYSAIALSVVPIIVVYCFISKYITEGMMGGAVKG